MDFNKAQMTALEHRDGPMMVLAGPGSGKTTVITHRIKRLLEAGVDPSGILVITFTKAAAAEMKERFLRLAREEDEKRRKAGKKDDHLPKNGWSLHRPEKSQQSAAEARQRAQGAGNSLEAAGSRVSFGTFHSVFYHILKWAYRFPAGNVISGEEKRQYFKKFLDESGMEVEDEAEFISSIINEISYVKGERLDLKYYYSQNCPEEWFKKLYDGYDEMLEQTGKIDFDDMLVMCHELFTERKDILAAWQKKYPYILIDEFQDINQIQFEVVKLLAGEQRNLFVVGDDDQSIYRFRGAKPEIMLRFEREIPGTKTVLLDTNYRSQANIVEDALNLIGHNKERFQKRIRAALPAETGVEYAVFEDQRKENLRIIRDICDAVERGKSYRDFAVLFRTNTQPRLLMEQMMEYNIPFRTRDRIPNLYEHWIAKDVFAYIRIAQGSRERRDFLQIMNRPKRYISRDSLDEDTVAFDVWEWYFREAEQPWVAERIVTLEHDVMQLRRMNPFAAINYIRKGIGYDEFCAEYADYRRIRADELYDVLDELQESARGYEDYDGWFAHIENYTRELERLYQSQEKQSESVALSTLHSAKGLEYENVYLIDVNEGVMPYKKAVLDQDIEEERRMFYVGMTRAKKYLHLFSVKQMNQKDADISRFIAEAGERLSPPCR